MSQGLTRSDQLSSVLDSKSFATSTGSALRYFIIPFIFILLGLICISVDLGISEEAQRMYGAKHIIRLAYRAEIFGHGLGVLFGAILIFTLSPEKRKYIPRIMAGAYLGGILANIGKLSIERLRPSEANLVMFADGYETFGNAFPLFKGNYILQSFPSSHTSTAVAFAIMLAFAFPRGKYLFAIFAFGAGLSRILTGSHYASDVLIGAGLGWGSASLMLYGPWVSTYFNRCEANSWKWWGQLYQKITSFGRRSDN